MLKLVVDKVEDVEEKNRDLYKKGADGKFYLQTEEDTETKKKIDEFRTNNIKLMKEKEDLEKKMASMGDPTEIAKMKKKLQEIEDKKMIEAGKLDELVDQKVARMKTDFENQIKKMTESLENKDKDLIKINEQLSSVLIDSEITKAVTSVGGVRKDAMQDILSRGRKVWRLEDGKPVPKEGDKLLYGKDGKAAMTFDEWANILADTAPFLFEGSGGSGAGGSERKIIPGSTKVEWGKIPPNERLKMIHGDPKLQAKQ
jgi:hypothetical protein